MTEVDAEAILQLRIDRLKGILKSCTLCPRKCGVDRTRRELGFCSLADDVAVSHALPHSRVRVAPEQSSFLPAISNVSTARIIR